MIHFQAHPGRPWSLRGKAVFGIVLVDSSGDAQFESESSKNAKTKKADFYYREELDERIRQWFVPPHKRIDNYPHPYYAYENNAVNALAEREYGQKLSFVACIQQT